MVEIFNKTPPYVASAPPGHLPLTRFHTGESTHTRIPVTVYRREAHLNVVGETSYHWTPDRTGSVTINPAAQPSLWASRPNDVYSRAVVTEPGDALSELDLSKGPQLIEREREELARRADYRARVRRERILEAKTCDPSTVHETQQGLSAFEGADQADVDASSTSDTDDRLDGLPVFISDDELPDGPGVTDPSDSGPDKCDRCGGPQPWTEPLERGLNGIRGGGIADGNSDYEHCDPDDFDSHIIDCHCCGCPACGAKSIRYRVTRDEMPWACNNPNCGIEFAHPVERPDIIRDDVETDEEKRSRLYWECRLCGGATQAPFVGIPEELL